MSLPRILILFPALFLARPLGAADVWSNPAFSVHPAALRQAAESVKAEKQTDATVLLNDLEFTFDEAGRMTATRHLIYRVESQQGVEGWAETSGRWEAWHQDKPEIKARVITSDGVEHWLDAKTLSDVPVHQDAPDIYTDVRRYGGPLPAIAPGALVEEQVIVRDNAPLFPAGTVRRLYLAWNAPVNRTHIVVTHPESLPLHVQSQRLPEATVQKTSQDGRETITLDQGPMAAYTEPVEHVPPDVALYPEFEFTTGTSWGQVASEYARLSEDKLRLADVQPLVAKSSAKGQSRDETIRRMVAALHNNVRYTGVEFGESALIPQFPAETLKRNYGDCKDKATLLVAMLRSAGIAANLALLDAGPGQDISRGLPGMGMFDHAIVYVPPSGPDPELWIDATAQYSRVGTLPWMDYGRWALVVDAKTQELRQIPEITAATNVHRETREFTLAEHGAATIVETDDNTGPADADYRAYYSQNGKQVRESSENYVKSAYLADSLTSMDHGDLADFEKPATIKFVVQGRRGYTDLTSAIMAIRVEGLFDSLPAYFRTKEPAPPSDQEQTDQPKERTAEWWITPFTTEWRYRIKAPLGFKLRALPADKSEKLGPINFDQKYSANPEGTVVDAVLRVEDAAPRLTARQAQDLRDSVVKARDADPILITFDHEGYSLIAAGKTKEGLAAYEKVAAQHPQEALHKVQLAQALLTAGLGEEARQIALEATTLEPKSALAFSTLGGVLRHDLIGQPEKKGMDYPGAVAAYRKAIALDPKDKETRANLALLLEFDADGTRYSQKAELKEAVAEFREVGRLDEEYGHRFDDNILYDLWYAHDYQGVLNAAAALPASDVRKGLSVAATALLQSPDAALKKSLESTTGQQERGRVLMTAGSVLMRVRRYPEAAALMAEGARGQEDESQIARNVAVLKAARPFDEVKSDPSDPRSVVRQFYGGMLSGEMTLQQFQSLVDVDTLAADEPLDAKQFQLMMSTVKVQLSGTALPLATIADMAVSNMHFSVEGSDELGYKIIVETPGAAAQHVFVVREDGGYRIAGFSLSGTVIPEGLAVLALRAIEKNNLPAARAWLDRARDEIHIAGGDDPLAGKPFPYFWSKGQEGELAAAHTAALVLLRSKAVKGAYLSQLDQARRAARPGLERDRLTMATAWAHAAQEHWSEMLPLTQELLKSQPASLIALNLATIAYANLKMFDAWQSLVEARRREHPDEMAYVRSSAQLAEYRGDFRKAREILKGIIDRGEATPADMNQYAWDALFLRDPIGQDSLDVGQRASDLTSGKSFAILHTLACVDAQAGKTTQARELLLKAIEAGQLEEPNDAVWFGFGLIAEQYGIADAAAKMFKRVGKPKTWFPGATFELAQEHLAALPAGAGTTGRTAGK